LLSCWTIITHSHQCMLCLCVQWFEVRGDCSFCFNDLRSEVIVHFVQWFEVRGDCLFCSMSWGQRWLFILFNDLRSEVIVHFVQWFEVRGDCLFCSMIWGQRWLFILFNDLRSEVIVCFVDIGWIVDNHRFKVFFKLI
jgi:hypothetical protein